MGEVKQIKQNRIHDMMDILIQNKDNIDQLIVAFEDKNGVFSSATACHSYVEDKGMIAIMDENLTNQAQNDEFEPIL